MDYKINSKERSALYGLPYTYQLVYLLGIRPYMDFTSGIVGIKRGISYQSLTEELYVEPQPGIKAYKPSIQQMRRAVSGLEKKGLVNRESEGKHLILKCVLATADNSVQNKADSKPTGYSDRSKIHIISMNSDVSEVSSINSDCHFILKAGTPPVSGNYLFLLKEKFEKFWELYPNKKSKEKAWTAFQALNPSEALYLQMRIAIFEQIDFYQNQQQLGHWMPAWKYPSNWLNEKCWQDEIQINSLKEKHHAVNESNSQRRSIDPLWNSCKPSEVINNILTFSDFIKAPPIG